MGLRNNCVEETLVWNMNRPGIGRTALLSGGRIHCLIQGRMSDKRLLVGMGVVQLGILRESLMSVLFNLLK